MLVSRGQTPTPQQGCTAPVTACARPDGRVGKFGRENPPRVGLPLIPLGTADDYRRTLEHPDLWRPHRALGVIGEALRPQVAEIARVLREQAASDPPFLVAHPLAFGARVAQEALGPRLVTLHPQATVS